MTRRHASGAYPFVLATAAAATTWLTLLSWRSFTTEPTAITTELLVLGVLIAAIGGSGRWLRLPVAAVVLLQIAVAGLWVLGSVTGSVIITPTTVAEFARAFQDGVASSRAYSSPIPDNVPPIAPLLLASGAALLVVVDLLAGALRRIPLAGLVLLTVYIVPVTITGVGVSWEVFVALAAGFMGMLHLVNFERLSRWGRGLDPDEAASPSAEPEPGAVAGAREFRTGAVHGSALVIGVSAIALALALPTVIPTFEVTMFDGNGPGNRQIEVINPLVDLRRDLERGVDIPLLLVTTQKRNPSYFRTSVLTSFNGEAWTPGDRDIPEVQVARGEMPSLVGVSPGSPREETTYNVRASDDFESTWLPTTPQVSSIDVLGDWRYDASTMDFMTTDDETTAAGLTYSFTGVSVEPDPQRMDNALSGAPQVGSAYLEVPGSVSKDIRTLTALVTSGQPTRFRQAQALQQWFRRDGGFVYSLEAMDGPDQGDLDAFLAESGRVGYCEQFAASMAIMARIVGIPSRVAVGFLESRPVGPTTWEFSSHDLHAWPELFFPGAGWVRFEPTPGARAEDVPSYTRVDLGSDVSPTPSPSGTPSAQERPSRDARPSASTGAGDEGSAVAWSSIALLLGVLVVLTVGLGPAVVRRRRRERRLRGDIEDLWLELRDHAVDLGHRWPHGRSPRAIGAWLSTLLGSSQDDDRGERPRRGPQQDPGAVRAIDRLVESLERERYARSADALDRGRSIEDVRAVTAALDHGVGPRVKRRARWLPRSLRSAGHQPASVATVARETEDSLRG